MPVWLFFPLAFLVCLAGLGVVLNRHPVRSAMCLVATLFLLAVFFVFLDASFVAALQIIVYAGAIMVLFVFVIMLLNAGGETKNAGQSQMVRWLGIPLFTIFLGVISYIVQRAVPSGARVAFGQFTQGSPRDVGRSLFTQYLLPFEATSVLVLIAILGAVVLARKEIE